MFDPAVMKRLYSAGQPLGQAGARAWKQGPPPLDADYFVTDTLARRAKRQQRLEIGEAAERHPRDAGDCGAEQQDEAGFDRDLDWTPRGERRAEHEVREVEVFVHPDQQRHENEAKGLENERFIYRALANSLHGCSSRGTYRLEAQPALIPCYNRYFVTFLPGPA